jgi:hypothetical protein
VGATSRGEEVVRRRQDTGAGEAGDDRHGTAARIGDKGEERGGGLVRDTAMWASPGSVAQRPVKRIQLKISNDFK